MVEMDHKIFIPEILGGLEEVMDATSGLCIPRPQPRDLEHLLVSGEEQYTTISFAMNNLTFIFVIF